MERLRAARAALDATDPTIMLSGRNENFRDPALSPAESIARAVAYAQAGSDCVFVPFITDPGAVRELVAAVAPIPVNVVVHDYDDAITELARIGVHRCSLSCSLAKRAWATVDEAIGTLQRCEADARRDPR